jgi:hypothetical protein
LPIRGRSHGEELETFKVEFDAEWYSGRDDPTRVVTIDPNVPSRYDATEMGALGTFPTMTLFTLAGDRMQEVILYLSRGRQAAEELWPQVRRLYEYYLESDWARFDKTGKTIFADEWRPVSTTHERATVANQAVGLVLAAIVDDEHEASAEFLRTYLRAHMKALDSAQYRSFARSEVDSGLVPTLQRRVFDLLDLFIQRFESWHIGLVSRVIPQENEQLLDDLRLFRDEFDILRDLYQQAFETICKTLRYPVAAQNTAARESPNAFGDEVPSALQRKTSPSTMLAFEKLHNFEKLQYVGQVPGWGHWVDLLNNRTRNAIGHASARHDLRTGRVLSETSPSGVPYMDVVADVYGIFDALCVCLQVLRTIRVAASPDFESHQ